MIDEGDISIIIPVYNEEKRIRRCLNSLKNQDFPQQFEVVVVDNGCTDETIKIAKKYDFIKVVKDFGFLGSAYQTGLKNSSGKYVAFFAADQVADSKWLLELYKFRHKGDAILGSIRPLNTNTYIAKHFECMLKLAMSYFPSRIKNKSVTTFGTGNVLIDRKKALDIGFDRNLPTAEDGDFSFHFLQKRYTIFYNPEAVVYHEMPTTLRNFLKYHQKLAVGSMLLIKKHKNFDLINNYASSMFYPISPIYIWRVLRNEKSIKARFVNITLGFLIFLVYFFNLFDFRNYTALGQNSGRLHPYGEDIVQKGY
jgi:glycosyltransferase involved in cell wall biosynthesis